MDNDSKFVSYMEFIETLGAINSGMLDCDDELKKLGLSSEEIVVIKNRLGLPGVLNQADYKMAYEICMYFAIDSEKYCIPCTLRKGYLIENDLGDGLCSHCEFDAFVEGMSVQCR